MTTPPAAPAAKPAHQVEISVNGKAVTVLGHEVTGLQIKEAAIDSGLPIQLTFQLSEKLAHKETKVIGDDELVKVHHNSKFVAVAGDDNS